VAGGGAGGGRRRARAGGGGGARGKTIEIEDFDDDSDPSLEVGLADCGGEVRGKGHGRRWKEEEGDTVWASFSSVPKRDLLMSKETYFCQMRPIRGYCLGKL
jgi:hypothetical protein